MTGERFVSLDAARGVGAFSVVLWHWSHFFDEGVHPAVGEVHTRPFSEVFYWLYSYGWMGVEFFFVLSGFIFFHYYYALISDRQIGAGEFFKRRFARLYPLHGLTLLIVIVLQEVYRQQHSSNFVYPPGTTADLLQAVTLTSHWWPNQGFIFNGPSWSISVECFLYSVFFVCARFAGQRHVMVFLALAAIGLALTFLQWPIGRGLVSFFSGALVGLGLYRLMRSGWYQRAPHLVLLMAIAFGATLLLGLSALPVLASLLGRAAPAAPWLAEAATGHLVVLLAFPYLVLLLALIETVRPIRARVLRFLGDCSYSIYLLHFPLQLLTVVCLDAAGVGRAVFGQPLTFVAWCALLFGVSALSHYGFEKPLQRRIRALGGMIAVRPSPTTVSS
jgi:peptidoglycan/LPS O-acetylase OafA/YrhL